MSNLRIARRIALAAITLIGLDASTAQAALSPKYQRLRELEAILAAPAVTSSFPEMDPIQKIEFVRPDLYRVSTAVCRMDVTLHTMPLPPGTVGARQFRVVSGKLVCTK